MPVNETLVPEGSKVGSEGVAYFAYGANISKEVFLTRRRFDPLSTQRGTLPGYELLFAARGMTFIEPAFAALREAEGGCVEGILYSLRREDAERLHRLENGYDRIEVDIRVRDADSSRMVRAYSYNIPHLTHGLLPSRRYLALLCAGARSAGLPPEYVASLEGHPSRHIPILSPLAAFAVPFVEALLSPMPKPSKHRAPRSGT